MAHGVYNLFSDSNIWRSVINAVHADGRFIGHVCYEVLFIKKGLVLYRVVIDCQTKAVFFILFDVMC